MRALFLLPAIVLVLPACQTSPTPMGKFSSMAEPTVLSLDSSDHRRADSLEWTYESHPRRTAEASLTVGEVSAEEVSDAEAMALSKLHRNSSLKWAKVILASRTTTESWHISALREEPALESLRESFDVVSIVHTRIYANGYGAEDHRVSVKLYSDGRVAPFPGKKRGMGVPPDQREAYFRVE